MSSPACRRGTFDRKFAEPRSTSTDRFCWDYWSSPPHAARRTRHAAPRRPPRRAAPDPCARILRPNAAPRAGTSRGSTRSCARRQTSTLRPKTLPPSPRRSPPPPSVPRSCGGLALPLARRRGWGAESCEPGGAVDPRRGRRSLTMVSARWAATPSRSRGSRARPPAPRAWSDSRRPVRHAASRAGPPRDRSPQTGPPRDRYYVDGCEQRMHTDSWFAPRPRRRSREAI